VPPTSLCNKGTFTDSGSAVITGNIHVNGNDSIGGKLNIGNSYFQTVNGVLSLFSFPGAAALVLNPNADIPVRIGNTNAGAAQGDLAISNDLIVAGDAYTDVFQNWSSSANPVGWVATPTVVISYKKIGKTVFVYYYISGISNSGGSSFTLPYTCAVPIPGSSSLYFPGLYSTAAVTMAAGTCNIANGSMTCTLGAVNNTSFPTTLAKSVQGEFFYETN
jgi:hypothetical protein